MSLITTDGNRIVMKKAESMMAVPYVNNSTYGWVLGSDVYDISAIIGDSTTLEQADGETATKMNEFKASPLLEIHSGGKYNFSAQCLDLQNAVLKSLFGAMTVTGVNGAVAFGDDFIETYALIRIRFADESLPDVYLPKVQLNSKLFINQLKTRASQGNLGGVALATYIAVESSTPNEAMQFDSLVLCSTYTPYTPVFFAPKTNTVFIYHHERSSGNMFSLVNFVTGLVSDGYTVLSNGAISNL